MKPVYISAESLARSPRALNVSVDDAVGQHTRFADLPLPARLLLTVPRIRGNAEHAPIAERYVLDTLGRIIDAGPDRRTTIQAVNILAGVLLQPTEKASTEGDPDRQWLSAVENLVLCILCKVRSGNTGQARSLANHWLENIRWRTFKPRPTVSAVRSVSNGRGHMYSRLVVRALQHHMQMRQHTGL